MNTNVQSSSSTETLRTFMTAAERNLEILAGLVPALRDNRNFRQAHGRVKAMLKELGLPAWAERTLAEQRVHGFPPMPISCERCGIPALRHIGGGANFCMIRV